MGSRVCPFTCHRQHFTAADMVTQCFWLFTDIPPLTTPDPYRHNTLTQKNTYAPTHTKCLQLYIPMSIHKLFLVFLNFSSLELYKQIYKQASWLSVQKSSLQCLVCQAANLWLMNMEIYHGRVNRAEQVKQHATALSLFINCPV